MKKYILSLFAVVLAVGMAAFTGKSDEIRSSKLLRYTAPGNSYSQSDVEKRSNWVLVTGAADCPSNIPERACEIVVDESQLNPDNSLKSSFLISASQHGTSGVFYVNSITSGNIHNKGF